MMEIRVQGTGPTEPFFGARDVFETEFSLDRRVEVKLRSDPDERTWTAHYDEYHELNMSEHTASSAMARELALHEFSHMRRHEERHPSHVQSTREAIFLALSGHEVHEKAIVHAYQIANHMKDIYADDLTLSLDPGKKLVAFLESELAAALLDRPSDPAGRHWERLTPGADPDITVINAAFALALLERNDCIDSGHRLYDLAYAAEKDSPRVHLDKFKEQFRTLARDPDHREYRKSLVEVTREYAMSTAQSA